MSDLTPTQKGILRTLSKIKDEIYDVLDLEYSPDYCSADDFMIACEDWFSDANLVMDSLLKHAGCSGMEAAKKSLFNFIVYNCIYLEELAFKHVKMELVKSLAELKHSRPTDQLAYEARLMARLGL